MFHCKCGEQGNYSWPCEEFWTNCWMGGEQVHPNISQFYPEVYARVHPPNRLVSVSWLVNDLISMLPWNQSPNI
jgi:hypothetical protein